MVIFVATSHAQSTAPPRLLNISTRSEVREGDNFALIGGFIVTGSVEKRVIIRALGPSLEKAGLPRILPDPTLELANSSGVVIAANDDWKKASNAAEIQATGLAPSNDLESAIVVRLARGQTYTAIVRGFESARGIALVEVYDLNNADDSQLANISTRGLVDTGDDVMIGGFILGGGGGRSEVVVRALGFSLGQAGVTNALDDPILELHDSNGGLLARNDDWRDTDEANIRATGLAPSDELESAIVAALPAGNYTAVVAGVDGTAGVGLVEVYNLQ
ncbi:MAG: DVUA0089 family protein [Chthoniobacterales bacterium]